MNNKIKEIYIDVFDKEPIGTEQEALRDLFKEALAQESFHGVLYCTTHKPEAVKYSENSSKLFGPKEILELSNQAFNYCQDVIRNEFYVINKKEDKYYFSYYHLPCKIDVKGEENEQND